MNKFGILIVGFILLFLGFLARRIWRICKENARKEMCDIIFRLRVEGGNGDALHYFKRANQLSNFWGILYSEVDRGLVGFAPFHSLAVTSLRRQITRLKEAHFALEKEFEKSENRKINLVVLCKFVVASSERIEECHQQLKELQALGGDCGSVTRMDSAIPVRA